MVTETLADSIRKTSNFAATYKTTPPVVYDDSHMFLIEEYLEHRKLYIQTEREFLDISFKELWHGYGSWSPCEPKDLKHPPVVSKMDFCEKDLPIGMGSFRWGSDWYMVGGEKVKKDLHQLRRTITGLYKVICAIPEGPSVELTDTIPKMKAGKARPIVEVVEGKIFVHHSMSAFHDGFDKPDPVFEYYDPLKNSWAEVPDVPYVEKNSNGLVGLPSYSGFGHFIIGSRLFIPSGVKGLYCFDTSSMKWDNISRLNLLRSFNQAGLAPPLFGRCVSGLDDNTFVIICLQDFGCFRCPRPYAHLIDKTGRLLCSQDLSEQQQLFNDFLPYVSPTVESRFIDLGSGRVCAIIYGQDRDEIEVVLHICIFELQKLPGVVDDIGHSSSPEVREFLCVKILKKYFCKLTGLVDYMCTSLLNAFII